MDDLRVLRRELQQVLFEAVRVAVEIHRATIVGVVNAIAVVLQELPPFEQADLLPVAVQEEPRPGAGQPVDAQVDQVAFAPVGRHQPAGDLVLFDDARLVAVHLAVDAGAEPGDPGADDEDGFLSHNAPRSTLECPGEIEQGVQEYRRIDTCRLDSEERLRFQSDWLQICRMS